MCILRKGKGIQFFDGYEYELKQFDVGMGSIRNVSLEILSAGAWMFNPGWKRGLGWKVSGRMNARESWNTF